MGYLDIKPELITELKVTQNGVVTVVTDFEIKNTSEFTTARILAPTTTHVSEYLVYFDLLDPSPFSLEMTFDLTLPVWSIPSLDIPGASYPINFPFPGKHYTITGSITQEISQVINLSSEGEEAKIPKGFLGVLTAYKGGLNILPILHALLLTSDSTNLFTYMA